MSDSDQQQKQPDMGNAEVARVLRQIADMLEFQNENPLKFGSYRPTALICLVR